MNFAVVVVEIPPRNGNSPWPAFQREIHATGEAGKSATRPSENVWLLSLPTETPALACVVAAAQAHGLAHRVLYFRDPPTEFAAPAAP